MGKRAVRKLVTRTANSILVILIAMPAGRGFAGSLGLLGTESLRPGQAELSAGIPAERSLATLPDVFVSPHRASEVLENAGRKQPLTTRGAQEAQIYASVSPSVVLVVTETGLGSGSLVSASGEILTNWHVVEDAEQVGVIFKPEVEGTAVTVEDIRRANVVKVDEVADLALLRVDEIPRGRTPLELGNLEAVRIGADVHAIGHPTGEAWTYTRGFVSQIRRGYQWQADATLTHTADVIQTQTPINPGNSGGPLISESGRLIGVNSFKSQGEALNFAVAVDDVRSFLNRDGNRVVRTRARESEKECEVTVIAEERRVLSGVPGGVTFLDGDCDGSTDMQLFTPDDTNEPVALFGDLDGDGRVDAVYFDEDRDGNIDTSVFDSDGDGQPDLRGYHRDGEFEPYRLERM